MANISRRQARINAMQIIYAALMNDVSAEEMRCRQVSLPGGDAKQQAALEEDFTRALIAAYDARHSDISMWTEETYSRQLDMMTMIERAVVAVAIAEMLDFPGTSVNIIINEAVEIAKHYGVTDGHVLVNGVLDNIATRLGRQRTMREHEIIRRYFGFSGGGGVITGVGDDAAVLRPPADARLVMTTDTLVAGVHFFADMAPFLLARKAAAVSLSDIAAMGGKPLWMTVALTAPPSAPAWFEEFARGLVADTEEFGYAVVGGDLTRGTQLSVTTTVTGACYAAPVTRGGARVGDDIWLSGQVGEAAFALAVHAGQVSAGEEETAAAKRRLESPTPRLALGFVMTGVASAAMDISDGLVPTAKTMAKMSGVRLRITAEDLPVAPALQSLPEEERWQYMFGGGDDYELLLTAAAEQREWMEAQAAATATPLTRIGTVIDGDGVRVTLRGKMLPLPQGGYEHDFTAEQ